MKKDLGQVFTPAHIVDEMIGLITFKNPSILEPSSGDGAFYFQLKNIFKNITSIELDGDVAHKGAKIIDFFDFKPKEKFDVIIGNPPYVEHRLLDREIFNKFDSRCIHKPNLYMLFIERSLEMLKENGELIFIIPTEWATAASFKPVLKDIVANHTIQFFKLVDENVWDNASVTTAIVKIKKGTHKKIPYYLTKNGKLIFGKKPILKFNGKIQVKVGAASGNNSYFFNDLQGDTEFVTSKTIRTKKTYKAIYEKEKDNWIRKIPKKPAWAKNQIFVNSKTRETKPFYTLGSGIKFYDASVLCLYTDLSLKDTNLIAEKLNKINWKEMGVYKNGRYHLTQSILQGVIENE